MIFIKIFLVIFIILLCYFINIRIINIKILKKKIKNYFNALLNLKDLLINKNIKIKVLEKRFNQVSIKGLTLLFTLFKILIPYILCFVFILLLKFNIPIFINSIIAFIPYIMLIKR